LPLKKILYLSQTWPAASEKPRLSHSNGLMAGPDLSCEPSLKSVSFESTEDAINRLQYAAHTFGFSLVLSTSKRLPYVRLHCSRGSHLNIKPDDDGNFPGQCPFYLRLVPGDDRISSHVSTCVLLHNHIMNPTMFRHKVLIEDDRLFIRELAAESVSPAQIQKMLQHRGIDLSTIQITAVARPDRIFGFHHESADLARYIEEQGGRVERYIEKINNVDQVVAVFTQTRQEAQDFADFGECIALDGTHAQLLSKWEVFPVTVLDSGRHLRIVAICFTAHCDQNVIAWMLCCLWHTGPQVQAIWRALITDRDSAFQPAMPLFQLRCHVPSDFMHVYCAQHATTNFSKKISHLGLAKATRDELNRLAQIMAYSDHRGLCDEALASMSDFNNARLDHYIDKHVRPFISQYAKSHIRPMCFTGDQNTSSMAEASNNMLKNGIGGKVITLVEARIHFDARLANHRMLIDYRRFHERDVDDACKMITGFRLQKAVRQRINIEVERASQCEVEVGDGFWMVTDWNGASYRVELDNQRNMLICDDFMMLNAGHWCRHQYAVSVHPSNMAGPIDRRYISSRRLKECGPIPNAPHRPADDEPDEVIEPSDLITQMDREADVGDDLIPEIDGGVQAIIESLWDMSHPQRYIALFHFAKGLCSIAAQTPDTSAHFVSALARLRDEFFDVAILHPPPPPPNQPNEPADVALGPPDARDAIARVRGRPKTTQQVHAHVVTRARVRRGRRDLLKCALCGAGDHEIEDCDAFWVVEEARGENRDTPQPTARSQRCPACLGWGHTSRGCRFVRSALEQIQFAEDEM
jgi:hypothetical protein